MFVVWQNQCFINSNISLLSMLQLSVYLWYIYKRSLFSLFVGKTDVVLPEGLKERERREVMLCTIIIWWKVTHGIYCKTICICSNFILGLTTEKLVCKLQRLMLAMKPYSNPCCNKNHKKRTDLWREIVATMRFSLTLQKFLTSE